MFPIEPVQLRVVIAAADIGRHRHRSDRRQHPRRSEGSRRPHTRRRPKRSTSVSVHDPPRISSVSPSRAGRRPRAARSNTPGELSRRKSPGISPPVRRTAPGTLRAGLGQTLSTRMGGVRYSGQIGESPCSIRPPSDEVPLAARCVGALQGPLRSTPAAIHSVDRWS